MLHRPSSSSRLVGIKSTVALMLQQYEDAQALTTDLIGSLGHEPAVASEHHTDVVAVGTGSQNIDSVRRNDKTNSVPIEENGDVVLGVSMEDGLRDEHQDRTNDAKSQSRRHRAEQIEQLGHVFARIDHALIMAYGTADGCRVALPVVPTMHTRQAAATLRSMGHGTPRTAATFRRKIDAACDEALAILHVHHGASSTERMNAVTEQTSFLSRTSEDKQTSRQLRRNSVVPPKEDTITTLAPPPSRSPAMGQDHMKVRALKNSDAMHANPPNGASATAAVKPISTEPVVVKSSAAIPTANATEKAAQRVAAAAGYASRFALREGLLRLTNDDHDQDHSHDAHDQFHVSPHHWYSRPGSPASSFTSASSTALEDGATQQGEAKREEEAMSRTTTWDLTEGLFPTAPAAASRTQPIPEPSRRNSDSSSFEEVVPMHNVTTAKQDCTTSSAPASLMEQMMSSSLEPHPKSQTQNQTQSPTEGRQQSVSDPWTEGLTARLRRISEAVRAAEQHAVALRPQCEAVVAQLEEARALKRAAKKGATSDAAPKQ